MAEKVDYVNLSNEELLILAEHDPGATWEHYYRETDRKIDEEIDEPENTNCSFDCGQCFEACQPKQVWFTEPPGGHNGWE